MILDTNALSAWAEGDRSFEPVPRSAAEVIDPVIVLGEFDYGLRPSRHYQRYADWLDASLDAVEIAWMTPRSLVRTSLVLCRVSFHDRVPRKIEFQLPLVGWVRALTTSTSKPASSMRATNRGSAPADQTARRPRGRRAARAAPSPCGE